MAYKSENIANILKRMNTQYFLPAIQRQFVWDQEKIISLFDSILRGYPISSFLFWELEDKNKNTWDAYKFLDTGSDDEIRNDPANGAGIHQMTLILDGQQRLTSILIGLKGTYEKKQKYKRWDDPTAWTKQKLYIDLLKDPNPDPNEDPNLEEPDNSEIYYGLKFFDYDNAPSSSTGERWFELGKILDFDNEDNFYKFREEEKDALPDSITKKQISIFERNLERLYRAVWKDDVISYYTETDQDYDRVLDIFVRANEGGTKLSKSDLLLSMITSSWHGMNARDEIYDFVDHLNNSLNRRNKFDKDFVMKSCLVLSDLPVAYKVQNFTQKNLNLIKKNWNSIKRAVEAGVNASNYYGVDGDNLTSTNALIPICYYLFKHPEVNLAGDSSFDVKNSRNVRNWLIASLLNGVFGGSSDSMLSSIRSVLQPPAEDADFPLSAINKVIEKAGRTAHFDDNAVADYLSNQYNGKQTFLALSILYRDYNWGAFRLDQDHIFPQSIFNKKNLSRYGLTDEQINRYIDLKDSIANLELLSADENQEKHDKILERWLATRDESFRVKHLIPDDPELWRIEKFPDFIHAREKLIEERLMALFK
jgi:uncharacterized protein with ParB-like and HNH nuclease domain